MDPCFKAVVSHYAIHLPDQQREIDRGWQTSSWMEDEAEGKRLMSGGPNDRWHGRDGNRPHDIKSLLRRWVYMNKRADCCGAHRIYSLPPSGFYVLLRSSPPVLPGSGRLQRANWPVDHVYERLC